MTKTEGIVLHSMKYGEQKMIVDMFTREWGRVSFVVIVPKTQKGRLKKQYFQPMTLLEIECDFRLRVQLQKLVDARLLAPYSSIPFMSDKLAISLFIAEFLNLEQRNDPLFDYIKDSMLWLDAAETEYANFHLTFLMRLSRFLGFYPNLIERGERREEEGEERGFLFFDLREGRFCSLAPTHRDFLSPDDAQKIHLLMRMDYPTMHLFRLSHQERNRICAVLLHYYRLHIPKFPELKSLTVLQELFS